MRYYQREIGPRVDRGLDHAANLLGVVAGHGQPGIDAAAQRERLRHFGKGFEVGRLRERRDLDLRRRREASQRTIPQQLHGVGAGGNHQPAAALDPFVQGRQTFAVGSQPAIQLGPAGGEDQGLHAFVAEPLGGKLLDALQRGILDRLGRLAALQADGVFHADARRPGSRTAPGRRTGPSADPLRWDRGSRPARGGRTPCRP